MKNLIGSFSVKDSIYYVYSDNSVENAEQKEKDRKEKEKEIQRLKDRLEYFKNKFTDSFLKNAPMEIILKEVQKEEDVWNKLKVLIK